MWQNGARDLDESTMPWFDAVIVDQVALCCGLLSRADPSPLPPPSRRPPLLPPMAQPLPPPSLPTQVPYTLMIAVLFMSTDTLHFSPTSRSMTEVS